MTYQARDLMLNYF